MPKDAGGQRIKAWRWIARDRSSLCDLEFLLACSAQRELHQASVRLRLPKPAFQYDRLKPNHPSFELAVKQPGRVLWRELDSDGEWRDEEALEELRRVSDAQELRAGRWMTPLHRPDPS